MNDVRAEWARGSRGAAGAVVLLAALAAGCSEAGAGPPAATVRDSAGVQIVENQIPDSAAATWWSLETPAEVTIGGADADEAHAVFQVSAARRLSDGRIVVSNGGTAEVRYYGSDGAHERTSGGRGGGPGEFQRPGLLLRLSGDSVLVNDAFSRRLSLLDPDGAFVREVPMGEATAGAAGPLSVSGRFADGRLLATRSHSISPDALQSEQVSRAEMTFVAVAPGDASLDTIATVPGAERAIRVQGSQGSISAISITTPPFAKTTTYATSDSLLHIGTQDAPEVRSYDRDGALVRIIRIDAPMRPVTPEYVDAWIERQVADLEPARQQEQRESMTALAREVIPPYGAIEVDARGNLWIQDYDDRVAPAGAWSVFDDHGRFIARIHLPAGIRVMEIGEDYLLGLERVDLDVEQVRLYRIRRADAH